MKILIAEDDLISRRVLAATLEKFGYEVIVAADGAEAWSLLQGPNAPQFAILDWMMPELDGVEVCRRVRSTPTQNPPYLILLTARSGKADVVAGLDAGANDYVTKPFDSTELRARVQVGEHVLELQNSLATRIGELEAALSQVKQLQGLLPICSYCKKIRDEKNYWQRVDDYLAEYADVRFTHGICPDCYESAMVAVKYSQRESSARPKEL